MNGVGWAALGVAALAWPAAAGPSIRLGGLASVARLAAAGSQPTDTRRHSPSGASWWGHGRRGWAQRVCVVVGSVVVASALLRYGPMIGLAAAAGVGLAAALVRDAVTERSARTRRADLTAAVRLLVAELEAGSRAPDALAAAAEAGESHRTVFAQAAQKAASGGEPAQSLLLEPDTRPAAIAWQLAQDSGAAPAVVLARVAADLDAARDQDQAVATALAGPQSSAAVLTGLPVIGLLMGLAMGAHPVGFLLDSPAGRVVCCAGVLLDVGGVLWVRRIVRAARRT